MGYLVYRHTCIMTGKSYVGYTGKSMEERWNGHLNEALCRGSKTYFHKALRKYGPDVWIHEVVKSGLSLTEALALETATILGEDCMVPNGYNMYEGGKASPMSSPLHKGDNHYMRRDPNARLWMSITRKGVKNPNISAAKKGVPNYKLRGVPKSREACEKTAAKLRGRPRLDIAGENNPNHDPVIKAEHRARALAQWKDPAHRRAVSEKHSGKVAAFNTNTGENLFVTREEFYNRPELVGHQSSVAKRMKLLLGENHA